MQSTTIKAYLIGVTLFSAVSLCACDPQQDSDPQQNRDKYVFDVDFMRAKLLGTPRYQDTDRILNFLNFSYNPGFKPIAVYEYASGIVDARNTESKDQKPFDAGVNPPESRTAKWCGFCDKKLKAVQTGTPKSQDLEDFTLLCGTPLASTILKKNQSTQYRNFLNLVAQTKKQYTS